MQAKKAFLCFPVKDGGCLTERTETTSSERSGEDFLPAAGLFRVILTGTEKYGLTSRPIKGNKRP